MGRRNLDRYSDADWREAGMTVGAIIANRWLVYSECDLCRLRIEADLKRIAEKRGMNFVLWGRSTRCRRTGCPGERLVLVPAARCECGCGYDGGEVVATFASPSAIKHHRVEAAHTAVSAAHWQRADNLR